MLVVIDTNILVSAFWSKDSKPASILNMVLTGRLTPCFDHRILQEYHAVLSRPRFGFSDAEIQAVLQFIEAAGYSVTPEPVNIAFTDESDKKFYEVAKFCAAKLITGNLKHFPKEPDIITPAAFLATL